MVKDIIIRRYKKFKNQNFNFTPHVNLISGTNGTCKTTLLHIVSNSFQEINNKCTWITDPDFIKIFKGVNQQLNPKMEKLVKGDRTFNDPAPGHQGNLYGVSYFSDKETIIEYRRHNTRNSGIPRYYIKPPYSKGSGQNLPYCPVVYLGLTRLLPYGEYQNENDIKASRITLPESYIQESVLIYKKLTGININKVSTQKMGTFKTRFEFESDLEGIDSNTISSGEDNISIIINSLLSLKFYYENITDEMKDKEVCSILLIDEMDATLHPSIQNKLLDLLDTFSRQYKIQVFLTTHSLSLIEHAFKHKHNIIYLINNLDYVVPLKDPDIFRIKMHLNGQNKEQVYQDKIIPIYTEDQEARDLLNVMFRYWSEKDNMFKNIISYFHFVQANLGADNLRSIFHDHHLRTSTIHAICILDGDKTNSHGEDLSNQIITLPGKTSPEKLLVNHALDLFQSTTTEFWNSENLLNAGYSKQYFSDNIQPDIDETNRKISEGKKEREEYKKFYGKHKDFLLRVFNEWVISPHNQKEINEFFHKLNSLYKKVASLNGLNPVEWNISTK